MRARAAVACCLALATGSPAGASAGTEQVSGWCTYWGTMTADGLAVAYGGYAVATASGTEVPSQTVVTCSVVSPAQGLPGEEPTLRETVSVAAPGPVAATAATTRPLPLRPLLVCVSGQAVFDPVTPTLVSMPEECRSVPLDEVTNHPQE